MGLVEVVGVAFKVGVATVDVVGAPIVPSTASRQEGSPIEYVVGCLRRIWLG